MATQTQSDKRHSCANLVLAGALVLAGGSGATVVSCDGSGKPWLVERDAGSPADGGDENDPIAVPTFSAQQCEEQSAGELFAQRIEPLLEEDRPKSCNQCHLSGVDMGAFVRDDPCETMACLVEDGLVDLDDPAKSVILTWIARAEPDSELITNDVIDEEYQGFLQWIAYRASCAEACEDVKCGPRDDDVLCATEPELDEGQVAELKEQELDCSDLALEKLFRDTIYRGRGRCYPCHYDNVDVEFDGDPPRWAKSGGTCAQASLATLRELQRGDYFDTENPEQSRLILKPLSEDYGGIEHGGSDKFHGPDDPGYQSFMLFIGRYAECAQSRDAGD